MNILFREVAGPEAHARRSPSQHDSNQDLPLPLAGARGSDKSRTASDFSPSIALGAGSAPEVCATIRRMLEERDVERLIQAFATRADLPAAVSNLATNDDINGLLNSIAAESCFAPEAIAHE